MIKDKSNDLKVLYSYSVGFYIVNNGSTVYVSNRFANEFQNEAEARATILAEYETIINSKIHGVEE